MPKTLRNMLLRGGIKGRIFKTQETASFGEEYDDFYLVIGIKEKSYEPPHTILEVVGTVKDNPLILRLWDEKTPDFNLFYLEKRTLNRSLDDELYE